MTQKLHAYNEYTSIKTYVTNVEVINQERCHLQETNTIKFMAAEREGRNENWYEAKHMPAYTGE